MVEATRNEGTTTNGGIALLAPPLFVIMWATGFVGARLTMPHAEPMTTLSLRFLLAGLMMAALARLFRQPFPRGRILLHQAIAGLLIQAIYLSGVFAAVRLGLEAGASAVIVGVQPVLTAALAVPLLGERVSGLKWAGLGLGLVGVALVVAEKLGDGLGTPLAVGLCVLSLVAIALGTVWQKRFLGGEPIFAGTAVQYAVSLLACGALALLFEARAIDWTAEFILGLVWMVVVLSGVSISLLFWLIARGAAANVASLFFLVPPVATLMGFVLFGEELHALALLGMALAAGGVVLVNRAPS